jgi:DNA polymerase elongation subunit (family B)
MFQAIHVDKRSNTTFLRDDEGWHIEDYVDYAFKPDSNGKFEDLFGKKYKKVTMNSFKKGDATILEQDVSPTLRVLSEKYLDNDNIPENHTYLYFDIECEILDKIDKDSLKEAKSKITSLAMFEPRSNKRYVLILDTDSQLNEITEGDKIILPFKTETALLKRFLQIWKEIDCTILVTYNGDYFDVSYIYYRISKVLGKKQANSLSPLDIVIEQEWNEGQLIKIAGINSMDMLRLYKKFQPKQLFGGFSLDNVCKHELQKGKIKFSGSLNDLFKNDINKFIEYNLNDVDLLFELEQKLSFIQLALQICHVCKVEYDKLYYSSVMLEGAVYCYLKKRNIISPNKPTSIDSSLQRKFEDELVDLDEDDDINDDDIIIINGRRQKRKFKGAFVKNVIKGIHSFVFDNDFTALYPSILLTTNASIETYIGRVVDTTVNSFEGIGLDYLTLDNIEQKQQNIILELQDKSQIEIHSDDFVQYVRDNNFVLSANGMVFRTDKESVIAGVVKEWMDKRSYYKKKMFEEIKKGNEKEGALLQIFQSVYKIFANSLYGVLSLPSFRYTSPDRYLASATTAMGQSLIKNSIDFVNDKFNKELGLNEFYDFCIASDTDSLFIRSFKVAQHRLGNDISEKNTEILIPFTENLSKEVADEININLNEIALSKFNATKHFLSIKPEYVIERCFWMAKKQYSAKFVLREGIPIPKDKQYTFVGLSLMKANFPQKFKEFSKKLFIDILEGSTKDDIDDFVIKFKEETLNCNYDDITLPIGIKQHLVKYEARPPRKGEIFSRIQKGALSQFRASIYYNNLIKFYGLEKKYPQIGIAESVKYAYLTQNPFMIETLAYKIGVENPPEIMQIIDKYINRDKNFDNQLLKKIQSVYTTLNWGTVNLNSKKNKFFSKRF